MPNLTGDLIAGLSFTPSLSGAQPMSLDTIIEASVYPDFFKSSGDVDDTNSFAAARASGALGIKLLPRTYVVDQITLKQGQSIIGAAMGSTTIQKKGGSNTPLFILPAGPVNRLSIGGFQVDGNGSSGDGFYMQAQPQAGSPFNGGLWDSRFFDLDIHGFGGNSFWFRGGATGIQLPHQFINFDQVISRRNEGTTARALLCTGQVGQFAYHGCRFECVNEASTLGGCNIEMGKEYQNGSAFGGSLIGGVPTGTNSAYAHTFDGLWSQGGDRAIYTETVNRFNILSGWFENLKYAIEMTATSFGLVTNARFANAGTDGAGGGFCIKPTDSTIMVGNNSFA